MSQHSPHLHSCFRAAAISLIAIGSIAAPAAARAGADSACEADAAVAAARRVQAHYEDVRDLRADFTQTSETASIGGLPLMMPDVKSGKVVFAKPGKMRWTYRVPEPSVVVSNGSTLWIHDVAGESVTRLAVTAGFLSGAALQFLLGDGQILTTFDVEAAACEPARVELVLVPKEEATYERLGLVVDPGSGQVVATSVLDLFGNLTKIEFSGIETNRSPGDSTFEFEVPEGVEVIEYDASPPS